MRDTKWMVYSKRADFGAISARFSVSPMLARILINRDIAEDEMDTYLNGRLDAIPSGALLPDMAKSVEILAEKIRAHKLIRIIGDYDIDGVCSTYILLKGMRALGANADYDIPDRIADGYGLNLRLVERAAAEGVDTIVTCDNGIAARNEVAAAVERGLTVIVTDHHEVAHGETGEELLPPAHAVIDPKREGSEYPFSSICGAVVAWKLIEELYLHFGKQKEDASVLLPFAAIATVGDVMPLRKENRIIVREGLKAIGSCENVGLQKLIARCELNPEALSTYHIGFVIGPCLNAGGRLESAKLGLTMLLEGDETRAEEAAERLKALNDQRKQMTENGIRAASEEIDALPFAYANEDLIAELSRMEPFGQGNVRPCFGQKHVEIRSARVLGKNRNVVKLSLRDEAGTVREAIAFTDGDAFLAEMAESKYFAVLYFPELNEYLGRTSLQLVLKAWKFER